MAPSTSAATIVPPTQSAVYSEFEYSAHRAPAALQRELAYVFPDATTTTTTTTTTTGGGPLFKRRLAELIVVPTCQRSAVPLTQYGDAEVREKDRLLERFLAWARPVCEALWRRGHWADVTDPCTGQAYFGHADAGGGTYSDVDGLERLLKYRADSVFGGCRVVSHPRWRFHVYPATLFTTAPADVVRYVLAPSEVELQTAAAATASSTRYGQQGDDAMGGDDGDDGGRRAALHR